MRGRSPLYLRPRHPFYVVIVEMLTTGLVDEPQVTVSNSLYTQGVADKARFIPASQTTQLGLAQTDFTAHGVALDMPLHLWDEFACEDMTLPLSNQLTLNQVNFNTKVPERFRVG